MPGNKIASGRPPRNYSIAQALSIAADQQVSIDDEGKPLTRANIAAAWLWRVVAEGLDSRRDPDGGDVLTPVGTRDRMEALKTILSRIEPGLKLTDSPPADDDDETSAETIRKLDELSDDELKVLEKIGYRKGGS